MVSSFRIWILTTSHTSSLSGQIWRRLATGRSSSLKRMVMRSILWTLGSRNYPNVSLRGGHLCWLSFWIRTWRWTTPEFSLTLPRGLLLLKLLLLLFMLLRLILLQCPPASDSACASASGSVFAASAPLLLLLLLLLLLAAALLRVQMRLSIRCQRPRFCLS